MKNLLLSLICLVLFSESKGQDSARVYKNEFGLDATGFVKQFFYLNGTQFPTEYSPLYYLSYRRKFKKGNIRFAVGGYAEHIPFTSPYTGDTNNYTRDAQSVSARIGWEFFNDISRRWQIFYGADFLNGYDHVQDDAPFWNGGYANGYETKTVIYGIGAMLGVRFRINDRISLLTESSLAFLFSTYDNRKYFLPTNSQYQPLPDITTPRMQRYYTSFAQPVSLYFTFDI